MPEKQCWKSYVNKATETLDILLHDEIGYWGDNSKEFTELLSKNKDRVINVDINSPGGSVFDGFAMFNALKAHKAPVNIKISGVAASIASVIAMAGDSKPEMPANTMMMIHKPMINAGGNADELKDRISILDKMQGNIVSAYKRHSSKNDTELNEMVNSTTWMTADEAETSGFASSIPEAIQISNMYDFTMYNYAEIPEHVAKKYRNPEKEQEKNILNKISDLLKPNKKEPQGMDKKEYENKIDGLEVENKRLETVVEGRDAKISDLENVNKDLNEKFNSQESEKITNDLKGFLDGLVNEAKLTPVNYDTALAKLEALNVAGGDLLEDEKKIMNLVEPKVDLSGDDVASKNDAAQNKGEAALENAIKKYQAENKCSYRDAYDAVGLKNPELLSEEN